MAGELPYTGGHFALDIMGADAGFLKKFDGLQMEADIVTNDPGPANAKFTHGAFEANREKAARFSCEFYVEAMELTIKYGDKPK